MAKVAREAVGNAEIYSSIYLSLMLSIVGLGALFFL